MEDFFEELSEGEFFIRDRHQFELKTEYSLLSSTRKNIYDLEFYFFIPDALQVNPQTYSKNQFYQDLTSLIRFKTPDFSLSEIMDTQNPKSPLTRVEFLISQPMDIVQDSLQQELKLLGNIFRSLVRKEIKASIDLLKCGDHSKIKQADEILIKLCSEITQFRQKFWKIKDRFCNKYEHGVLTSYWNYIDEFLSITFEGFFTGVLKETQDMGLEYVLKSYSTICGSIHDEVKYRNNRGYGPAAEVADEHKNGELYIYRKGLLKKFVLDVLLLSIQRKESSKQYSHISHLVAAFAAGFSMLVYLLVFVWKTNSLIINSTAFILGTVLLYIVKDRLKEETKILLGYIFEWLPDYTTLIKTPDREKTIGKVAESFKFIDVEKIPAEILHERNKGFHQELVEAKRIEHVFRYRKKVTMKTQFCDSFGRRYDINNIFRFNVSNFLQKARDAYFDHFYLDSLSEDLIKMLLHKVYHINIIIKNTYKKENGVSQTEIRKIRLILDKNGLDRIEKIY